MQETIFPKGLVTMSNNANPKEDTAFDVLNMYKDSYGNIRKLQAFDDLLSIPEGAIDSYYYSHTKELLIFYPNGIKKVSDLQGTPVISDIPNMFVDGSYTPSWSIKLSFAESGKILYIADPSGVEEVIKYDGKYLYRAGVPVASVTGVTAGPLFLRVFLSLKDNSGIETFGDYEQHTYTSGSTFYVSYPDTYLNVPIIGGSYPAKFGYPGFAVKPLTDESTERTTKTVSFTIHNLDVGDVIWAKNGTRDAYNNTTGISEVPMKVESIEDNFFSIALSETLGTFALANGTYPATFSYSGVSTDLVVTVAIAANKVNIINVISGTLLKTGDKIEILTVNGVSSSTANAYGFMNVAGTVVFTYPQIKTGEGWEFANCASQMRANLAISDNATYGYLINYQANNGLCPYVQMQFIDNMSPPKMDLGDIYDDTVVKGIPPKFKYITMFAGQMIGLAPKDTSLSDTVYWSDLGVGSTVETFAPFDYQVIGKSDEGDGTAIFANTDHLVVFKKRDIYYMIGNLYGKQYRIVKATTEGVGCISHKTVKPLMGGCSFLADRGAYFTTGQAPVCISDVIEEDIKAVPDKELSYLDIDYLDKRIFLIYPTITYEYTFEHKEWYRHSIMDKISHVSINTFKYAITNTALQVQGSGFNHECFYRTAWQVKGFPDLKKKFNSCTMVTAYGNTFTVDMEVYSNWTNVASQSDGTELINPDKPLAKIDCKNRMTYSQSFKFKGTLPTDDMVISAMSYEYESYQTRTKDR